jgi:hypothetical protein
MAEQNTTENCPREGIIRAPGVEGDGLSAAEFDRLPGELQGQIIRHLVASVRLGSIGGLMKTQFTRSSVTGYPKYVEADTNFGSDVINPGLKQSIDQLQADVGFIKEKLSR